jgi:hypothetical protein
VTPRAALALLAGLLLISGTTLLAWAPDRPQLYGLLLGAAAGAATLALLAGLPSPDAPRNIANESVTVLVATVGALMVLLGVAVGLWLVLLGVGVFVGGIGGVVRDSRSRSASR